RDRRTWPARSGPRPGSTPSARLRAGGRALRHRRCPAAGCPSAPDSAGARPPVPSPARRSSPRVGGSRMLGGRHGRASCSSRCPRRRGPARPSRRGRPRRQRKDESATFARLAVDPDSPAVQLHEPLRERKPETRPFALTCTRLRLLELLEVPPLILGRDTRPRVRDRYEDLSVERRRLELDTPSRLRELLRIRKQAEDHLPDSSLV